MFKIRLPASLANCLNILKSKRMELNERKKRSQNNGKDNEAFVLEVS